MPNVGGRITTCEGCGAPLKRSDIHCVYCGRDNPLLDEEAEYINHYTYRDGVVVRDGAVRRDRIMTT